MQERKRVEAVGRQDSTTTAAASLSHSEIDVSHDDSNLQTSGGDGSSPTARAMYLAKRKSVVDGFSAQELLMHHRRSLIGLPLPDGNEPVARPALADLEGVTLSKRHTFTKTEYEAQQNVDMFRTLEGFKTGFEEGLEAQEPDAAVHS